MSETASVRYSGLLRNREFAALLAAQVASGLGDQIARVALALLVYQRSGSASASAATFAVSYLPLVFGGAILGPLADRIPRRTLLLACDLARFAIIGLLAILAAGSPPLILLLLLLFAAELFTPLFDAAWSATLPEILTDGREYLAGSGLLRTLHLLQQVAGLAIGGIIVGLLGVRASLVVDAMSFLVSFALLVFFLKRRGAAYIEPEEGSSMLSEVRDGARDLFSDPVRRMLVLIGWGSVVIMITPMAVSLPYAVQVGRSATNGALLMAATVGGAALGAAVIAKRPPMAQVESVLPLSLMACLPLLVVSLNPPLPLALILWFMSGAMTGFLVPVIGTVALLTAAPMRGRVMALAGAGYNALVAVFYLLAGLMADLTTPSATVTVAGVVGLLLVALARIYWPTRAMRNAVRAAYADLRADDISRGIGDELPIPDVTQTMTSAPNDPEPEPQAPREERQRERTYMPTIEIVLPEKPVSADMDPRNPFAG